MCVQALAAAVSASGVNGVWVGVDSQVSAIVAVKELRGNEMLLSLVLCILGVAFLLMPGVLEALVRQPIENPYLGNRPSRHSRADFGVELQTLRLS